MMHVIAVLADVADPKSHAGSYIVPLVIAAAALVGGIVVAKRWKRPK